MIMIEHNKYNSGAQFLAHLTTKERTLLIKTQTGSNSLERKGQQMHWEWETAMADKKRQSKQLDQEEETTEWIDKVWMDLAKQAAQGTLQEQMTKLDAMVWIRHGIKILERIIHKQDPVTRRSLILENVTLLHSFAWLMRHPVPVAVMLDDNLKYFEKLGKIFEAGATIALEPFSQVGVALVDGLVTCAIEGVDGTSWKPKKVFQKLESTGWLERYLVWAAEKATTICKDKKKTLDLLKSCTSFVRMSFQMGTPCGVKVREIVKRDDSCPIALSSFADLIKISESVECAYKYCDYVKSWGKMYHCGRCRKVCYCCKECQIAAWAEHKPICCIPIDNFKTALDFVHHAVYQSSDLDLN